MYIGWSSRCDQICREQKSDMFDKYHKQKHATDSLGNFYHDSASFINRSKHFWHKTDDSIASFFKNIRNQLRLLEETLQGKINKKIIQSSIGTSKKSLVQICQKINNKKWDKLYCSDIAEFQQTKKFQQNKSWNSLAQDVQKDFIGEVFDQINKIVQEQRQQHFKSFKQENKNTQRPRNVNRREDNNRREERREKDQTYRRNDNRRGNRREQTRKPERRQERREQNRNNDRNINRGDQRNYQRRQDNRDRREHQRVNKQDGNRRDRNQRVYQKRQRGGQINAQRNYQHQNQEKKERRYPRNNQQNQRNNDRRNPTKRIDLNDKNLEIKKLEDIQLNMRSMVVKLLIVNFVKQVNGKIFFIVYDQTGYSRLMTVSNELIKIGNILLISQCSSRSFYGQLEIHTCQNSQYKLMGTKQTKTNRRDYDLIKLDGPPMKKSNKITHIGEIDPNDQDVTIIAEVVTVSQTKNKQHILCVLGDPTGVVNALLPTAFDCIRQGKSLFFQGLEPEVQNSHIIMVPNKNLVVQSANSEVRRVDLQNDISAKEFILDQDQSD